MHSLQKDVAIKCIDVAMAGHNYRVKLLPKELDTLKKMKYKYIVEVEEIFDDAILHPDKSRGATSPNADVSHAAKPHSADKSNAIPESHSQHAAPADKLHAEKGEKSEQAAEKMRAHHIWIVMEFCPNDLFSVAEKAAQPFRIPEDKVAIWIRQIGKALKFLHDRDVAHRDVKPENVLLRNEQTALLNDFSFVTILKKGTLSETPLCTPSYSSPEMIQFLLSPAKPYNPFACDVWGLACTAYAVTAGDSFIPPSVPDSDLKGMLHHMPEVGQRIDRSHITPVFKDLLHQMTKDPASRPTIADVLKHKWLDVKDKLPSHPDVKKKSLLSKNSLQDNKPQ